MNSFEEFKTFVGVPKSIKDKSLLYLVTYPDKLEWDYGVEKQAQRTYLQMSGGPTGAGTGHYIKLCKQSEVLDLLKEELDSTHVMICSVGMIFVVTVLSKGQPTTAITDFIEFSKSKKYCKAHIIAKPDLPAHLHYQHIELDLNQWRELGCPNIYGDIKSFKRSTLNYHDDYTPYWLRGFDGTNGSSPHKARKIYNFTHQQRERKSFSYGQMHGKYHKAMWRDIREDNYDFDKLHENNYFDRLSKNFNQKDNYYIENNEWMGKLPEDQEFDLLFSPCGGYSAEVFAHKLNFNGKVIIYDHSEKILDIKKQILGLNPDFEELQVVEKMHLDINFIWNTGYHKGRAESFGTYEEMRIWQEEMCESYDIDFWLMNLIEPDYNRLLKEVRGKKVFFNASNIFSYNKVILKYSLTELYESFDKLFEVLSQAEVYYFRGCNYRSRRVDRNSLFITQKLFTSRFDG